MKALWSSVANNPNSCDDSKVSTGRVVVGATVVAGATVVVVGATVVAGATVVVAVIVVVGAAVVVEVGAAVSELPPQADGTNRNNRATAYFLTVGVCHPSPEGGGGDIGAPRCRYAQVDPALERRVACASLGECGQPT